MLINDTKIKDSTINQVLFKRLIPVNRANVATNGSTNPTIEVIAATDSSKKNKPPTSAPRGS